MGVVPTLLYGMGIGAIYVSAFSLVGFVSFVLAGYLSDRLGRAASTAAFAALGVVSSIALVFAGAPAYFLAALTVVYVSSGFFSFTGVWASESYPMELRATATNIVFLVGRLLGGFSPMLVIALYPSSLRVGLGMSGAISAALALVGVAIYVLAGRMRREAPRDPRAVA